MSGKNNEFFLYFFTELIFEWLLPVVPRQCDSNSEPRIHGSCPKRVYVFGFIYFQVFIGFLLWDRP